MPELPEVETVVRDLRPHLTGSRFNVVRPGKLELRRPWRPAWNNAVAGRKILGLGRRGKWISIELEGGAVLLLHLGMTGQLRVFPTGEAVESHTHLIFDLDAGDRQLRFRDIRRFGSATLFASRDELDRHFIAASLGPEPFDLPPAYWRDRLARTSRCLKAVLLDQQVVAGVGNIYADESLFLSRLNPSLRGSDLGAAAANRLRKAIGTVLNQAIDRRGSSIRNYLGGTGLRGEFQNEFRVYGRTGKPCLKCRTPIVRVVLAGRSSHYCPRCQGEVASV